MLLPGASMVVRVAGDVATDLGLEGAEAIGLILESAGLDPGTLDEIGTIATVTGRRTTEDGFTLLAIEGRQRCTVIERSEHAAGTGVVEVADPVGDPHMAIEARRRAVAALRLYLGALAESGSAVDTLVPIAEDPVAASYQVASLVRLSEPETQFLLEASTAEERLDRVTRVLTRETALLGRSR